MNTRYAILILTMLLNIHAAHAASEYLRLTGTVVNPCSGCNIDIAAFDLSAGQSLYFDIEFDTDRQPIGYSDDFLVDYIYAQAIGGSFISGLDFSGHDIFGTAFNFPEGRTTHFASESQDFRLGTTFGQLDDSGLLDLYVGNWELGQRVFLFYNSNDPFDDPTAVMSFMTVSYRGSTPPPPIPLPASIWLLVSGLATLVTLKRHPK